MGYSKCAIVIPLYKERLNKIEFFSVKRTWNVLKNRPIYFIAPDGLNLDWYKRTFPEILEKRYPEKYFLNIKGYNSLMLSKAFYETWLDYEYILICQTDVYVFCDMLEEFCYMPYAYVGAPMVRVQENDINYWGCNGGFSLRNVTKFLRILDAYGEEAAIWNDSEDYFFSLMGERNPNVFLCAPFDISVKFAFDRYQRLLFEKNDRLLPFALHGWHTIDREFSLKLIGLTGVNVKEFEECNNVRDEEEKRFLKYVSEKKVLMIYGAGLWGKLIAMYLKNKGIYIDRFIISDDQFLRENIVLGYPVSFFSNIFPVSEDVGLIFGINQRFLDRKVYCDIKLKIQNKGCSDMFEFNGILINTIIEELLIDFDKRGRK